MLDIFEDTQYLNVAQTVSTLNTVVYCLLSFGHQLVQILKRFFWKKKGLQMQLLGLTTFKHKAIKWMWTIIKFAEDSNLQSNKNGEDALKYGCLELSASLRTAICRICSMLQKKENNLQMRLLTSKWTPETLNSSILLKHST